ncbi:hypothetical protein Efla_001073 [Eimeria flavescens]
MAFTPQQLQGGPSYSDSTLIGNWLESRVLRDQRRAEFQQRRAAGCLSYKENALKRMALLRPQEASLFCSHQAADADTAPAAAAAAAAETARKQEQTADEAPRPAPRYIKSDHSCMHACIPLSRGIEKED